MNIITADQVEAWIAPEITSDYKRDDTPEDEFRYVLDIDEYPVEVYKQRRYGPLTLLFEGEFDPAFQANILNMDRERRNFYNLVISVLTNTSGQFNFLDNNKEPTSFNDAEYIQLIRMIYPDGISQNKFSNSIIEIINNLNFIQLIMHSFEQELEDRR